MSFLAPHRRRRRAAWLAPVILAALLLAPIAAAGQGTPSASPAAVASPAASLPDTPVGRQLGWLLDQLSNGATSLTVDAIEAHFSSAFLAQVPPDKLIATAQAIASGAGRFTFVRFEQPPTDTQAVALVQTQAGPALVIAITVSATPPNLIEGLVFRAAAPQASPAASPVARQLPDTPVGRQLAWVLETLNSGARSLTVTEVKAHFSSQFLAQVPPQTLITTLQSLAVQLGTMTFTGFEGEPTNTRASALVATTAGPLVLVQITVAAAAPNLIEGLGIHPATATPTATPVAAKSWADVDRQLAALAPVAEVYAAEIVNGQCQTVHALNATDEIALGSSFKLYVLGELAHQIAEGKASWNEELAINDAWKSLPSGNMRNEPAGTKFTLQQYAEQMISASDNTAADHLIHRLGRENIEAFQSTMGHSHPALNEPFFTTKELFILKLALPPAKVAAYIAAPTAEKRQLLATEVDPTPVTLQEAAGWTQPRYIETLEWFASGEDLCRAMAQLHTMSAQPGLAPIQQILSINPGVPLDKKTWTYVGYKGGSEPGVLTVNWLLQRADGRWFMLSVGLNDSSQDVNEASTIAVAEQALGLLAQTK